LQCQSEPSCFAFCGMPFGRYRHQRIALEPSEVSPFCDKSRLTFTCCSRPYAPQRPAARSLEVASLERHCRQATTARADPYGQGLPDDISWFFGLEICSLSLSPESWNCSPRGCCTAYPAILQTLLGHMPKADDWRLFFS
jgi:hypothetical protein